LVVSNYSLSTYNPGILLNNDAFYWKVVAKDLYDNSTEGAIWQFFTVASNTVSNSWIRTYGNNGWGIGKSVLQTSDGGFIFAGRTLPDGIELLKTNALGNTQWYKIYGGGDWGVGHCVQETFDGGFIITGSTTGYYSGTEMVCLIKTDALGNQQWSKTFLGEWSRGHYVQQTSDGGYIITASSTSVGYYPNLSFYLIKTNSSGYQQWIQSYGGFSVQQTSDGGYIIAGGGLTKTDSLGNQIWHQSLGLSYIVANYYDVCYCVQQTSDGGFIIAGRTISYGAGEYDVFLIKTDDIGNQIWFQTYGGIHNDEGYSVQQTFDGGYIITGYTGSYGAGNNDVYLIKTDALGNQQWFRTFGGSGNDCGNSVQQTSDGGYIVVGYTYSFVANCPNHYLIKTDSNGNVNP
jgi:hypothetical protein